MQAKGGFEEKLYAYKERSGVNLKFSLADFIYLIQKQSCSYNNSRVLWASNKQNLRERTLDLPFIFRHERIISLKNHVSVAHGESLPYWFRGNFCGSASFDLLVE